MPPDVLLASVARGVLKSVVLDVQARPDAAETWMAALRISGAAKAAAAREDSREPRAEADSNWASAESLPEQPGALRQVLRLPPVPEKSGAAAPRAVWLQKAALGVSQVLEARLGQQAGVQRVW
jgi:hypothetical protein